MFARGLSKKVRSPLGPPLRGGSARRRWGRELYGCPKYFGLWQVSLPPPLRGTSLAEGASACQKTIFPVVETVGANIVRPQLVKKGAFTPWLPLRGGSARRRWGRELYGCPKYFGLWQVSLPQSPAVTAPSQRGPQRAKKHFPRRRDCRGEHCSPANLAQQRLFGKVSHKANRHGRALLAPTKHFFDNKTAPAVTPP